MTLRASQVNGCGFCIDPHTRRPRPPGKPRSRHVHKQCRPDRRATSSPASSGNEGSSIGKEHYEFSA
ncbi:hypothetical protein ACGFI9_32275 [Micromonospora sp. NPDC048930]|uniref:hypothetical protein n=1 Tax=Micromonospora sp. NPDC048930 TaxID=3364261 RepID=UPI0037145BA6